MATTEQIINVCLKQLGEKNTASPSRMSRIDVLFYINLEYRGRIAEAIGDITSASLTFTNGIASLPTNWLRPEAIYDGDRPNGTKLRRITDIAESVEDTAKTTQYMLPDNKHIWIFGETPSIGIKAYFINKPEALTDSPASTPDALIEDYHIDPFVNRIKEVYADNKNNYDDATDYRMKFEDYLSLIKNAHKNRKRDGSPLQIKAARWC